MLDHALAYAAASRAVFPVHTILNGKCSCGKINCKSPGKHPITRNGLLDATRDLKTIQQWWAAYPDANIAYSPMEGVAVVDVDNKTGESGMNTLKSLEAWHGLLPATVTAVTGGGGRHLYYRTEKPLPNGANLLPGIDVRTSKGYVLLSPSAHISGKKYEWLPGHDPFNMEIEVIPDWLFEALMQNRTTEQRVPLELSTEITEGSRNTTLVREAGCLRQRGYSKRSMLPALLALNEQLCIPPLDEAEVEQIVQSVARYPKGEFPKTAQQDFGGIAKVKPSTNLICMNDVERTPVEWLWEPYIPLKKITVEQGDPGGGKTFLAVNIAAHVSTGKAFPNYTSPSGVPANVIFQTAEDGLADTIKARLEDAGADCKRIFVIDESKTALTLDDARLREAVIQTGAKLVIIDPIQAYIGANKDMHRANEIRPIMSQLGRMAEETGCAVIIIGHMNKANGIKSIYRGLGSIDIAAAARSVLAVGEVPNEKYRRAVVQIKSSLAPSGQTILFNLHPDFGFQWAGVSDLTADEILNHQPTEREAPAREEAEGFLRNILSNGKMRSKDVEAEAKEAGISLKTLRDAREQMRVICKKGEHPDKAWYWQLAPTQNT